MQHNEEIAPVPTIDELDIMQHDDDDGDLEGFDLDDHGDEFAEFDPLSALGQMLVTADGETIPEVLVRIQKTLDTLTKVLHKIAKSMEK